MGIAILVLVSRHDRHVTGQGQDKACYIMLYIVATVAHQCLDTPSAVFWLLALFVPIGCGGFQDIDELLLK